MNHTKWGNVEVVFNIVLKQQLHLKYLPNSPPPSPHLILLFKISEVEEKENYAYSNTVFLLLNAALQ